MSLATNLPEEVDTRVGTWLRGKYRLDRVIGEGGMATVYAATHRNNKRFAVKMLQGIASGNAEMQARFLREGYLANTVGHAGAVAVLDDDVSEDGHAFIVMELLEGKTVEQLAPEGGPRQPLAVTLNVAYQVLDTLAAAHAKGIVHRDIKPANLFLTCSGQLKLLDFGIARLRDARSGSATQTGAMLGTPAFMGPEQALGKTDDIDARTDIWAVGASLFWLLAGREVHLGETVQHMLVLAATSHAVPLASVCNVPPEVATIVDRALAFDRADRWQTAAAMRDAIDAIYQEVAGEEVAPSSLARLAGVGAMNLAGPTVEVPLDPSSIRAPRRSSPQFLGATIPSTPQFDRRPDDALLTVMPVSSNPHPERRTRTTPVVAAVCALIAVVTIGAWFALRTHAAPDAQSAATGLVGASPSTAASAAAAAPPTGAATEPEVLPAATVERPDPSATAQAPVSPLPPSPPPRKHPSSGPPAKPPHATSTTPPSNEFDRQ